MTFSYVWITIACVLLVEILVIIVVSFISVSLHPDVNTLIPMVEHTAQINANNLTRQLTTKKLAALKLGDSNVGPFNGITSRDNSINISYVTQRYSDTQQIAFALLITPDDRIAISSYPARYAIKKPVSQLLPYATDAINIAMSGVSGRGKLYTISPGASVVGAAVPIWSKHHIVGVLYVEAPYTNLDWTIAPSALEYILLLLCFSGIAALLFSAPIGGIFGLITTRGLVHRLRNLVSAATLFADGNYEQRVPVTRKDEVGQLEQQFNRMAEQLVESITQRQELAEQNARLSERSRISRELHDAISQDLFSLSMLAGGLQTALPHDSSLQAQIATLSTTTTNMIREMRALLLELRPPQIGDLGLIEGLKELANSYSTRLGVTVNTEIEAVQLSMKAEHALLRISQEALTNAVRHANATTITLSLLSLENHIILTIRDDGSGFNPDENKVQHGLGLRLMQERIQELNGTFTLQSVPTQGTRIYICLPQEHACDSSLDC
ncbi:MAG: sensor histidine kinase [Ktedonobacteraceae bacterium]|nr:sensor histidine kinase [Ktedonobacteraceae bacterium]